MDHGRWHDPALRTLQMYLHAVRADSTGRHIDGSLLVVMQGAPTEAGVRLPGRPWATRFSLLWDSAYDLPPGYYRGPAVVDHVPGDMVSIPKNTVRIYNARPPSRRSH
jgi:hypothetical protein